MKFFLQIILKQQDTDSPKILFDSNKKSEILASGYGQGFCENCLSNKNPSLEFKQGICIFRRDVYLPESVKAFR